MLFLDRTFPLREHKLSTNKRLYGFQIGSYYYERGRHIGRRIIVETPPQLKANLQAGYHADLRFRVEREHVWLELSTAPHLCLMMSSRAPGSVTDEQWRHGMLGTIRVPRGQKTICATQVHAGQRQFDVNSRWEEAVINARPGNAFLLGWSDQKTGQSEQRIIYVYSLDRVLHCKRQDFRNLLAAHQIDESELPFTMAEGDTKDAVVLNRAEWKKL